MITINSVASILIGLLLGSIINIIVIRLPLERGVRVWPHCTRCSAPLVWWQLIPVLGWVLQRGRGRCCAKPLHWIFPTVELLSAFSCYWLYLRYATSPLFFYLGFIVIILLIVGAIDWLHRWIYTFVVLGGTVIVLLASSFVAPHNLVNALLGLLAGGFIFVIFYILARMLFPSHNAPFGLGDVYLALFLGASFGVTRLAPVLFIGMALAGIFSVGVIVLRAFGRSVQVYIAYGAFLCLGALGFVLFRGL